MAVSSLFSKPPLVVFRPLITQCSDCGRDLNVQKTRTRSISTLHVGRFWAREVFLTCKSYGHTQRSEELSALVPPGANFGYDVMVYAGKALFLGKHGISAKLHYRAKRLKADLDQHPELIEVLQCGIENALLPAEARQFMPVLNVYALIQWTLRGKSEGHGYGFPFDRPHLAFAKRIHHLHSEVEKLKTIQLRGKRKDNKPYFKVYLDLEKIIKDRTLWKTVSEIEEKITVFEKLRKAMRIAATSSRHGLNDEGQKGNIRTIEKRVKTFRVWLTRRKDYPQNPAAEKMIAQIDKYWEKLFADPIAVETPAGPILVQPQRTNNILEQFFRSLKRANRRRTGNASSSRMLRTILAETPLVRNLENPSYMRILLSGKASLEEVFAEVDIDTFRTAFREAQDVPEKIPSKLKPLIAMPDFPEKLLSMAKKVAA